MGKRIPVRTYNDWDRPPPGFLEIDLVAHCGGPLSGSFIHSLVATDICTGWTEAVPLLAREQSLVVAGLEAIGQRLPFPIRGIDSDNDSVFINETLVRYCADHDIEFTRSRAYRSNDQAWIEQKNGSVVRRFVGYDRYSGQVAGQTMAHLYGVLRLYVNFFQPSFKLIDKARYGADTTKRYSQPTPPCDRLTQHDATDGQMKAALQEYRASNCVGCQAGWAISAGHEPRHGELSLTMAFRMVSSLRMQATKATFFALPAASSLW